MRTNTLICIEYILEHEKEDYISWCLEMGLDSQDVKNSENRLHVFACAVAAYENETGLQFEFFE